VRLETQGEGSDKHKQINFCLDSAERWFIFSLSLSLVKKEKKKRKKKKRGFPRKPPRPPKPELEDTDTDMCVGMRGQWVGKTERPLLLSPRLERGEKLL